MISPLLCCGMLLSSPCLEIAKCVDSNVGTECILIPDPADSINKITSMHGCATTATVIDDNNVEDQGRETKSSSNCNNSSNFAASKLVERVISQLSTAPDAMPIDTTLSLHSSDDDDAATVCTMKSYGGTTTVYRFEI